MQTIAVKGVSLGFGAFIRFRERVGTQMLNDEQDWDGERKEHMSKGTGARSEMTCLWDSEERT